MRDNYTFTDITEALPDLLADFLEQPIVGSRAGRTHEMTHIGITLTDPLAREVLVPGRRCNIAAQIAETAWVLAGRNDIDWLSNYLPRARDFSDDGKTWRSGYGPRLRDWHGVDQLEEIVALLEADPETRRAVAVLYDPSVDLAPGKDIACNNWLSFLIRDGALDLHVAVRSNDAMWGWSGINVFEWSVLQEIVAGLVGVEVGQLHFSVTSFHLYERHWARAQQIVQESRMTERVKASSSPRFDVGRYQTVGMLNSLLEEWFDIEEGIRTGATEWSRIDNFPEPMLKSWLRVLDWWWNEASLKPLAGTALEAACRMGLRPPWSLEQQTQCDYFVDGERCKCTNSKNHEVGGSRYGQGVIPKPVSMFLDHAIRTHNEKHAAYGDSWKRRGEMLGIMANIARKIDRLGGAETSDETQADTALDLMVYLAKYRAWLMDLGAVDGSTLHSDNPDYANKLLVQAEKLYDSGWEPRSLIGAETFLRAQFDRLEDAVMSGSSTRAGIVEGMLNEAYGLARRRFETSIGRAVFGDDYRGADHD